MPTIQPIRENIIAIDRFLDILHADNLQERTLFLTDEITNETAEYFLRNLLFLAKKKSGKKGPQTSINILMNCPGGDESAGLAMYNGIKIVRKRGYHVVITVLGECCSIAPIVLQAASERKAYKYTRFMVHESAEIMEVFEKVSDLRERAKWAEQLEQWLSEIMGERTKLSIKQWRDIMHKTDHWFFADEALKYGLIDEIIE